MVASRIRVISVISAPFSARFWFSACFAALMPTSIGYQDLAALIAHGRHSYADYHLIASPFGTVETATFSYSRPVGTAMPEPLGFQTVNFDPRSLDAYSWKVDEALNAPPARQLEYPSVDRRHKGDRLPAINAAPVPVDPASLPQLQPITTPAAPAATQPVQPPVLATPRPKSAEGGAPQQLNAGVHAEQQDVAPPLAQMDASEDESLAWAPAGSSAAEDDAALADKPPELPAPGETIDAPTSLDEMSFLDSTGDHSADIYFGNGSMGGMRTSLQSWAPGAEPMLVPPDDPGMKLASLEDTDGGEGETIAGKDNSRVLSPAQQLGLEGKPRAHAEKCLADAVYFEARGEVKKGQEAVAQVVMNRVFSGYYPHDVCGVVYQNAGRHLACQFTFACEGKDLDRIDEPDMWEQAKQIAKNMLDGKIWLAEVGHATHYHAYWVHPSWVHEMARLYHLGVHTFYRPLNWGNGDDEPVWGKGPAGVGVRLDPEALNENPEPAPKNPEAAKGPQAEASPAPADATSVSTAKL
jgi:spore germination cell wall hydrolase CwlJ-like protein